MSLKDSWLMERQHRQQDLLQLQQNVQQTLADYGQARQQMAIHLWNDLASFREGLWQSDQARRHRFQTVQAQLQAYCQLLQQETREFLANTAADRDLMAQQLASELQAFHADLQANVRSLRADLQADLAMLQADTQTFLKTCQDQRFRSGAETRRSLTVFMDNLRLDVENTLADLAESRQQRADQLQQDLHQSRAERQAEVAALFADLVEFRQDLGEYRQSLNEAVWGKQGAERSVHPPELVIPKVTTMPAVSAIATKPLTTKPAAAKPPVASRSAPARNHPPSRSAAPGRAPKAAAKTASPVKTVTAAKVGAVSASATEAPAAPTDVAFEKEVYSFLHEQQGARLTQIETALKLNRFQAVDALRSLIKKGLITQRDRVYLVQAHH